MTHTSLNYVVLVLKVEFNHYTHEKREEEKPPYKQRSRS